MYSLLPDKQTHTYEHLFTILKDTSLLHTFVLSPTAIMVDFELAVHKAIRSVFATTQIRSCLFHYGQALHRKYQQLGLCSEIFKNDKQVQRWFRMFIGLAFVPVKQITTGFSAIQSITPQIQICDQFDDYFSNTWIHGQFPIDLWNHFRDERPRTNNFCEGYNSRLRKRATKSLDVIYIILCQLPKLF